MFSMYLKQWERLKVMVAFPRFPNRRLKALTNSNPTEYSPASNMVTRDNNMVTWYNRVIRVTKCELTHIWDHLLDIRCLIEEVHEELRPHSVKDNDQHLGQCLVL